MSQLEEDELKAVALLVFANKQDLPRAMSTTDITEALGLSVVSQPVGVQGMETQKQTEKIYIKSVQQVPDDLPQFT